MTDLNLTLACGPFDRTQALRDGSVKPEGINLTYLTLEPAEIFYRMINYREFDLSEMSITNYITLVALGESPFVAIPVFPSRVFRHGFFFINTGKGIKTPADLKGKRGGVVEYRQTAGVYMRGILQHEYGIKPSDVEWVQARPDRLGRKLPDDVKVTTAPPGSQPGDLLEKGEIDFLLSAYPPLAFQRGSPKVARLFPNYRELEIDFYKRTKIYPIMHLIVIRRDIHERHPWAALSLYKAFLAAKARAMHALQHAGAPRASFAWLHSLIEEEQSIIGKDWYFVPIAAVAQSPFLLLANPSVPAKSVAELTAYGKTNPDKLSFASAGIGTPHDLFAEMFMSMTGIKIPQVRYKGSLPAINDVIAGHVPIMFCDVPSAAGAIRGGTVRALGVTTKARLPGFPDIAPIADALPGFEGAAWLMIAAPAKTPEPVVAKLHGEINAILASPPVREQMAKMNVIPMGNPSVADMRAFIKSEIARWGEVVKKAGIAQSQE